MPGDKRVSEAFIVYGTTTEVRLHNLGLLLLRLGAGVSLLVLFGLTKLKGGFGFAAGQPWAFVDFNRKLGIPAPVLVAYLQTLNESIGALLVALGLCTRIAAGMLGFAFVAATFYSLRANEDAWLIAAMYALMFSVIALLGSGQLSLDALRFFHSRHGNCRSSDGSGR